MPLEWPKPEERHRVKRYRPHLLLIAGTVITMASIAWELARMNPATAYVVEPWSMRGYESVHGSITFTIGVLLLVAGLATMWERSQQPLYSRAQGRQPPGFEVQLLDITGAQALGAQLITEGGAE